MSHPFNLDLDVRRPTLLLDVRRVRRNIQRMSRKAANAGVRFRPHFKTHQSAVIGSWFHEAGVRAITVSSVDMARYFAREGWRDITVAFPLNVREIGEIDSLARRVDLHVIVDSMSSIEALQQLTQRLHVWIKVDVGGRRAGLPWSDTEGVLALAAAIGRTEAAHFRGLLTHAGHTYNAASTDEVVAIQSASVERLAHLRQALENVGIAPCEISIGDTPGCSVTESFQGVDEIRPGNFVFCDLMQTRLGSCTEEDIGVAVACPVVGKHVERNHIVLYGGAVHLSKDCMRDERGRPVYGRVARIANGTWSTAEPQAPVVSVSQEHGIVEAHDALLGATRIGDLLVVLPVHSCLTSDLYAEYRTLDGHRIPRRRSNETAS